MKDANAYESFFIQKKRKKTQSITFTSNPLLNNMLRSDGL